MAIKPNKNITAAVTQAIVVRFADGHLAHQTLAALALVAAANLLVAYQMPAIAGAGFVTVNEALEFNPSARPNTETRVIDGKEVPVQIKRHQFKPMPQPQQAFLPPGQ